MLIDQDLFLQTVKDFEEKLGRSLTEQEKQLLFSVLQKEYGS
ncbi:hypothetical protein [Alkalicoccobacillus murimartini]|uniref:Sulfur relay (Sulfurtransferase) DsrC/TusE family protein n=1 Tax=Alkalicoccobacillus murimartini TaxID=171685 RepID=A0ABT9YNA9_9BACI|nr:hypothetical protein [Alkalicoccobacillus murimartini]MDQ0208499.1 sulfur relay (sulfurtransferase) DsrC/TusE family protein [Alkalicoccobacillus murimartini]